MILREMRGEVRLFISPLVLAETERNLYKKAPQGLGDFNTFEQALVANLVNPTKTAVLQAAKLVALKDAPIVAAAR